MDMANFFSPDDSVLTCDFIERGLSFQLEGITACCESTMQSPPLLTPEEINSGKLSYALIVERRKKLFLAINGKGDANPGMCAKCARKVQKKFKDISLDYLGNIPVVNIQHYTKCNMKCAYCCYAIEGRQYPEVYPMDAVIKAIDCFKANGKCLGNIWCTFSGGEPTLLSDCDKFIDYFFENNLGGLCLFSNAIKYSTEVAKRLETNQIYLTTSIDAGVPSTFKKMRGVDAMYKVIDTLIRYKKTGTKNLWLKYIVTENNISEEDLFGFVFLMTAINPDKIYIAVDFPYGDKEIPDSHAVFAAKLWYYLKKYAGANIQYYSDVNSADTKFGIFYRKMQEELARLCEKAPLTDEYVLTVTPTPSVVESVVEEVMPSEEKKVECLPPYTQLRNLSEVNNSKVLSLCDRIYQRFSPKKFVYHFIKRSMLFDENFYREQYGQNLPLNCDCIAHYIEKGAVEGKKPAPWFDPQRYVLLYSDVRNIDPFFHYLRYGISEGRSIE